MRIIASVSSVIGETPPDSGLWAQTLGLSGVYAVVDVSDPSGDPKSVGMEILAAISKRLVQSPKRPSQLSDIADIGIALGARSVIAMAPVGGVLCVAIAGSGAVYLRRGDTLATLLNQSGTIAGKIMIGDILLLVSPGIGEVVSQEQMKGIFDQPSVPEIGERLTSLLQDNGTKSGGAALIYQIDEFTDIADTTVIVPQPELARRNEPEPVRQWWRTLLGNRKFRIGVAGLFFLLLLWAGLWMWRNRPGKPPDPALVQVMEQSQHLLEEGMALRDLNPLKGRERLSEAKRLLEPYSKSVPADTPEGKRISAMFDQISQNLILAMQIYQVKPAIHFNPDLIKPEAEVRQMAYSKNTFGFLDPVGKTIFSLTYPAKSGEVVGGGGYVTASSLIATLGSHFFVLSESTVYEVDGQESGKKNTRITGEKEWGRIVAMTSYDDNLYLLDTGKSRIWKYVMAQAKPEKREYLLPDTFPDLSKGTDITVDGFVWLSTALGEIRKFGQGREEPFKTSGIEPVLGSDIRLYTDVESTFLYVLDKKNHRVVILSKDGVYVAQYVYPQQLAVIDLAVAERAKKVFLLASGQLTVFDIK
jgi:hypothetical protein